MFVEGWQRVCNQRDGVAYPATTIYDPTINPRFEGFSKQFLRDLASVEYDIRVLVSNRGINVNWDAVWAQQGQRNEQTGRKGEGKRSAPRDWPTSRQVRPAATRRSQRLQRLLADTLGHERVLCACFGQSLTTRCQRRCSKTATRRQKARPMIPHHL